MRSQRGSSFMEYSLLLLAVIAALIAMQRAMAGAVGGLGRQAGDVFGSGQQVDKPFIE